MNTNRDPLLGPACGSGKMSPAPSTRLERLSACKTPSGDSCVCVIPSPEAGAMQGTSGILLIFGVLFLPVGLLKGGPPSFRRKTTPQIVGKEFTPVPFSSPSTFSLGVVAVFLSIFVIVPAIFVLESAPLSLVGVALAIIGSYLIYSGSKLRQ